jgi:predicted nucleic acid-binding protein
LLNRTGESAAIALALQLRAAAVMVDERDGVSAARKLGLDVIATLGVLDFAALRKGA